MGKRQLPRSHTCEFGDTMYVHINNTVSQSFCIFGYQSVYRSILTVFQVAYCLGDFFRFQLTIKLGGLSLSTLFDITKEDFVLTNFILSQVDHKDRTATNQTNLTWLTLVGGKSFTPLPSKLYFGKRTVSELENFRGQRVDLLLSLSQDGKSFNIKEVQPSGVK